MFYFREPGTAVVAGPELKPLVKIRNWNRDRINPPKYSPTAHDSPCPTAPFVANFSMRCAPGGSSVRRARTDS
jgi:hypothetical protein